MLLDIDPCGEGVRYHRDTDVDVLLMERCRIPIVPVYLMPCDPCTVDE